MFLLPVKRLSSSIPKSCVYQNFFYYHNLNLHYRFPLTGTYKMLPINYIFSWMIFIPARWLKSSNNFDSSVTAISTLTFNSLAVWLWQLQLYQPHSGSTNTVDIIVKTWFYRTITSWVITTTMKLQIKLSKTIPVIENLKLK